MNTKPKSYTAAQIREVLAQRRRLFRRSMEEIGMSRHVSRQDWREFINNQKTRK